MTGCCSRSGAPSVEALGPSPCARCIADLERAPPQPVPLGLDDCWALLTYEGPARDLVARVKYRNLRASVPWLAEGIAALVPPGAVEVVTWAPTSARSPPPPGLRPRRGARGRGGPPAGRAEPRAPEPRPGSCPDRTGPGRAPAGPRPQAGTGHPALGRRDGRRRRRRAHHRCVARPRRRGRCARAGPARSSALVAARTPNHPAG